MIFPGGGKEEKKEIKKAVRQPKILLNGQGMHVSLKRKQAMLVALVKQLLA